MTDLPGTAEDKANAAPDINPTPPQRPKWVKVFGIIAVALLSLLVIGLATGKLGPSGTHGPGRHMPEEHTRR